MQELRDMIALYHTTDGQEMADRQLMLYCIDHLEDVLTRQNPVAHFTASSWIVNATRDRVLMVWHNIYRSWSWTGGHADGDPRLSNVALREAMEETGAASLRFVTRDLFSLEALHVPPHEKRGEPVSAHIHLNATFLLEADESDRVSICPGENSGVQWMTLEDAVALSNEECMQVVYRKLNGRLARFVRS